jgi:hypothetical protein
MEGRICELNRACTRPVYATGMFQELLKASGKAKSGNYIIFAFARSIPAQFEPCRSFLF